MAEFKTLFTVAINHSFYVDRISRDFDITPLSDTAKLLKDNRLLFRNDDEGFRVLYRSVDESELPFLSFEDLDLKFALTLKEKSGRFENITELNDTGETYRSGDLVYFSNTVQLDHPLEYSLINELRPATFTYQFPQEGGTNGVIAITNEAGTDVTPTEPDPSAVAPDAAGNFFYPIDFEDLPSGLYTFETTVDAGATETKKVYIDSQLLTQGVFGLIKIHVVDYATFPTGTFNRAYSAGFNQRESIWRYKVVLKTGVVTASDDLDIVDTDMTVNFVDKSDELTNGILTKVWDSDVTVPYSELPTTTFDFVKDATTTPIVVLSSLANPPTLIVSAPNDDFGTSIIYITV